MWLPENEFKVKLGGTIFINVAVLIRFRQTPLFRLYRQEDGTLAIDFDLHDSQGKRIATVRKDNVYGKKESLYTVEGTADTYSLRDKQSGSLIIDIRRRIAASTELDISVITFLPDRRLLNLSPETSNIAGLSLSGVTIAGAAVGIQID